MKKRDYTLQQMGDSLCLTIKDKFLTPEFGLEVGDSFQLIRQDEPLILLKQPKQEYQPSVAELQKQAKEDKFYKRKTALLFFWCRPDLARIRGAKVEQPCVSQRPSDTGGRVAYIIMPGWFYHRRSERRCFMYIRLMMVTTSLDKIRPKILFTGSELECFGFPVEMLVSVFYEEDILIMTACGTGIST